MIDGSRRSTSIGGLKPFGGAFSPGACVNRERYENCDWLLDFDERDLLLDVEDCDFMLAVERLERLSATDDRSLGSLSICSVVEIERVRSSELLLDSSAHLLALPRDERLHVSVGDRARVARPYSGWLVSTSIG